MQKTNAKELRWRIIYGYRPNEYISIGEKELEKAKYCWITGKVYSAPDGKAISGREIKRIEPDFRFYTGWFDNYSPVEAEDFQQIERDVPMREIEARSTLSDQRVEFIVRKNRTDLLSAPEKIDQLLLTA